MTNRTSEWRVCYVPVTLQTSELISSFVFDLGAAGLEEKEDGLYVYFPGKLSGIEQALGRFLQSLQKEGFPCATGALQWDDIAEQDWNQEWKKNYHSIRLGDRLLIKPSWEPLPLDSPECVIEIDPGMAFGTGTHATTQLCLQLLSGLIQGGERILDVGTGTGILGIAAIKMGAAQIIAFDKDPLAAEAALKNAEINEVAPYMHISVDTLDTLHWPAEPFHIVLANINRTQIAKILPLMQKMLHYPYKMILSGILRDEEALILGEISAHHLEVKELMYQEEWLAILVEFTPKTSKP